MHARSTVLSFYELHIVKKMLNKQLFLVSIGPNSRQTEKIVVTKLLHESVILVDIIGIKKYNYLFQVIISGCIHFYFIPCIYK